MNTNQAIDKIFAEFDTDKSGALDRKKLRNIFQACVQALGNNETVRQEDLDSTLESIGIKANEKISKAGFPQFLEKLIS